MADFGSVSVLDTLIIGVIVAELRKGDAADGKQSAGAADCWQQVMSDAGGPDGTEHGERTQEGEWRCWRRPVRLLTSALQPQYRNNSNASSLTAHRLKRQIPHLSGIVPRPRTVMCLTCSVQHGRR